MFVSKAGMLEHFRTSADARRQAKCRPDTPWQAVPLLATMSRNDDPATDLSGPLISQQKTRPPMDDRVCVLVLVHRRLGLIPIVVRLVRAFDRHVHVVGLLLGQHGQLDAELIEVKSSDFLVQLLWQHVDLDLVGVVVTIVPKFQLSQHLVGERGAHHEAGVTGRTAEVHQTSLGQNDDAAAGSP